MKAIRVVHLIGGTFAGGAARGAYWLHQALKTTGIDSCVLTDSPTRVDDPHVRYVALDRRGRAMASIRAVIDSIPLRAYSGRPRTLFSPGIAGYRFDREPDVRTADVVHLHWVAGGFLNVGDLSRIDKPIVWTLRDMWPITGGCHYTMGCDRFTASCGACPQLASRRQLDLSTWGHLRKRRSYSARIAFVALSRWLADEAKRSSIVDGRPVVTIGNPIDCVVFHPVGREDARRNIGLDAGLKKVLLVGAQDAAEFYKGYDLLLDALARLDPNEFLVVLFGRSGAERIRLLGFEVKDLGFVADTVSLRSAYCAADVFVAPSRMEAFGKTIAEAMACGCPVVCFDATGPRDIVDHQVNGYLAKAFVPAELAAGVKWVTADDGRREMLASAARTKIETHFHGAVIARRYAELYARVTAGAPLTT